MAITGTRAPWSSWPCAVRELCLLWAQWAPCGHYDHHVLFWSLLAPWALVTIGTVAIVGTVAITGTLEIVVIVDTPSIVMMNHGLFVHCKHHATMVIVSLGGGGLWSFRAPNDHCFHYYHNPLTITMSRQPTMTMVMSKNNDHGGRSDQSAHNDCGPVVTITSTVPNEPIVLTWALSISVSSCGQLSHRGQYKQHIHILIGASTGFTLAICDWLM